MSEWRNIALGELCDFQAGYAFPQKYQGIQGGNLPFIKVSDMNLTANQRIITTANNYITNDVSLAIKAKPLPVGTTIFAKIGIALTYNRRRFLNSPTIVDNNMMGAIPKKRKIDPWFLYYLLLQIDFNEIANGSALPFLAASDLKRLQAIVPDLEEQISISSVLSNLDNKIDLLHRQNKTLEAMAETLFRQWFIEEAQDDWEEVTIGDFVEVNSSSIDKNYHHSNIQYLDTGSLTDGKIETFQSFLLSDAPSRAKRLVRHNDILISTVRPDQRHYGIIKNPEDNLVVSTGFCVLTCTKIDPHFIYMLLTDREMTSFLHSIAEGSTSTYPSLKPSDIACITFQLPQKDKLAEFSRIAEASWNKIEKNYIQIRTLEKLRDTLLPKLMSGEVRVAV